MTQYVWTHKKKKKKKVLSLLQILQGYASFITATKDNRNGQINPLRPKQIGFQADDKESSHRDPPLSDRRAIYQQLDSSESQCQGAMHDTIQIHLHMHHY